MEAIEIDFGNEEQPDEVEQHAQRDPDEFLAQYSFRIVYQTNNFLLPQIREMIDKDETLNLRPEYQRRLRWTNPQKSRLIESLLLNVPVPPVFFYEADAARYEVMDGQQRLSTIHDFFAGKFRLSSLKVLTPLNSLSYAKCPARAKRTLDRATISAVTLLMESDSERSIRGQPTSLDIRRLVFDRLNTGGRRLTAQEIRNALNPGELNDCIIELSRFDKFTKVFGIPPYDEATEGDHYESLQRRKNGLYSSMKDCELILRVFALDDPENIRGSMKSILDRAMEESLTEDQVSKFASEYKERFEFLYELFDKRPFNLQFGTREEKVSATLYDASMVAVGRVWDRRADLQRDKVGIRERLDHALREESKYEIIVGRISTAAAIKQRIDLLQEILLPG